VIPLEIPYEIFFLGFHDCNVRAAVNRGVLYSDLTVFPVWPMSVRINLNYFVRSEVLTVMSM
jgi:hypothetical protein